MDPSLFIPPVILAYLLLLAYMGNRSNRQILERAMELDNFHIVKELHKQILHKHFRRGTLAICIGIALMCSHMSNLNITPEMHLVGIVVFAMGVGEIIVYYTGCKTLLK
jgi:Domain of unknown function (DUF6249)